MPAPLAFLYGGAGSGINRFAEFDRRAVVAGLALLPLAAHAEGIPEPDLLERAMIAMGGRKRLARVKALEWTGTATVPNKEQQLEIEVKTRVEPFVRARSESNLPGRPETARTMIIEPDGGFVERNGTRTPLPPRQAEHERQQFGVYGYLLLAQAPAHVEGRTIVAQRAGLPPIRFTGFEGDFPRVADYAVANPDGDDSLDQRFLFEGEYVAEGISWPQTISIFRGKQLYFSLDLQTLSIELA